MSMLARYPIARAALVGGFVVAATAATAHVRSLRAAAAPAALDDATIVAIFDAANT